MAAPPQLTVTTIRYLFATSWLPRNERDHLVAVPGGGTTAWDTAANLLHTALWNLRRQGAIEFHQLRPVEAESLVVLGGRSFARFEFRDPGVELRGLEGALLRAARKAGPSGGLAERAVDRVSDEDDAGVRRLVQAMELRYQAPWGTVTAHCFAEAAAAGLVKEKGWAIKRVEIIDPAAVASLRERNDELRAARKADMEREPDLHEAVIADCLRAVYSAYGLPD
jgi:hypothetical protein